MARPCRNPPPPRPLQADEETPFDPMDTDSASPQTLRQSEDPENGPTYRNDTIWTLDRIIRDQVLEANRTMREATQDALETLPKFQNILSQTLCLLNDLTQVLTDHSKASMCLLWKLEELDGLLAEEEGYSTEPL